MCFPCWRASHLPANYASYYNLFHRITSTLSRRPKTTKLQSTATYDSLLHECNCAQIPGRAPTHYMTTTLALLGSLLCSGSCCRLTTHDDGRRRRNSCPWPPVEILLWSTCGQKDGDPWNGLYLSVFLGWICRDCIQMYFFGTLVIKRRLLNSITGGFWNQLLLPVFHWQIL